MQRIREGLKTRFRSLVTQRTGLDEMAVDDLATSTKLQSWEAVQIPERLRFSSRLAILLVGFFMLIVAFVPWTQTITVTGQLSAYAPFERPQDIEAQITGRIRKWHIFEGVRVKAGDVIASAGNSGGNEHSGLYFEMRHRGRAFDPLGWVTIR